MEAEQKAAREVLEKHEEEKARLEDEEERYWREYCTHKSQLTAMEDENRRCESVLGIERNFGDGGKSDLITIFMEVDNDER